MKRYSSGMYVRLAFAVAAHLEPEILIVDEVLAVGDWRFQRKCLGKMQDVATARPHGALRQPQPAGRRRSHRASAAARARWPMTGPSHEVVSHFMRTVQASVARDQRPVFVSADPIVRRIRRHPICQDLRCGPWVRLVLEFGQNISMTSTSP